VKLYKFTLSGCNINKRLLALPVCAVVKAYLKILPIILCVLRNNTACFKMFSMITKIYNKKTKGPTLMELLTATVICALGTDHCSSEEYQCTHVHTCVART
jgi:hypothetical protein